MFIKWDVRDDTDLMKVQIAEIWMELDLSGFVIREIGFDVSENVTYIAPAHSGKHQYGIFDLNVIDVSEPLGMHEFVDETLFEKHWDLGSKKFKPRLEWTSIKKSSE